MDIENRRRQLPALNWLDVGRDTVKREDEAHHNRPATTASQHGSNSTGSSPSYHHSSGPPPPPYTRDLPPSTETSRPGSWLPASSSIPSLNAEARSADNEELSNKAFPRQSLPSISEALGVDSKTPFAPGLPTAGPVRTTPLQPPSTKRFASPSPTLKRPYPMDPPPAPLAHPTTSAHSAYPTFRPEHNSAPAGPLADAKPAPHLLPPSTLPPSDPPAVFPRASDPAATYDRPPSSHYAAAVGTEQAYGYAPVNPHQYGPPVSTASGPAAFPQTSIFGAPRDAPALWSSESSRMNSRPSGHPVHGETVKRHLEIYDLEVALNDIAELSPILTDFSRRYAERMRQAQRQAPPLSMLPGIGEVDDMMQKSHRQLDALARIREVVIAQHAAHEQQAMDQRKQQKVLDDAAAAAALAAATVPAISTAPNSAMASYPSDKSPLDSDDNKQMIGESRKRRGRAAPPGRCHSCHRAETPEWRRGPDGARTLCNACGLHFAKLTRKQNSGAKPAAGLAGSTLRPKEAPPSRGSA